MEEVDRILIHSLRQIGCDIDEEIDCVRQFTTEMVVEASVRCLRLIKPGFELSHHLPPGMTPRFRVGSTLAQACMELGYPGEIGYQTFLYWGETDIRRLLMFLLEKIPKEAEKAPLAEPLAAKALLRKSIASAVKDRLQMPWLPPQFRPSDICWIDDMSTTTSFQTSVLITPIGLEDVTRSVPKEIRTFYSQFMDVVTDQLTDHKKVLASIIEKNAAEKARVHFWDTEWNQKSIQTRMSEEEYRAEKKQKVRSRICDVLSLDLQKAIVEAKKYDKPKTEVQMPLKDSRFTLTEKLIFTKDDRESEGVPNAVVLAETEEELRKRQMDAESDLKEQLDALNERLNDVQLQTKKLTGGIQQIQEQLSVQRRKVNDMDDACALKQKTLDLLPDADANLVKLQGVVEATAQRLVNLAGQWEKHRAPIVERYRHLRELNANRASETQHKLEMIRSLRETMKEIAEEARAKDMLHRQLVTEYEKMTRDVNRSAYTRRILEIVSNIKKQKQDIDKVLVDTKQVQKEINQLSGKLDRTFTVTDELVFKDAKKDEAVRKAYKYLAALHENCSHLVKTVEETGIIMREIRDLEDQIENESQKKVLANLERITADYKQMKQENAALLNKLKERPQN